MEAISSLLGLIIKVSLLGFGTSIILHILSSAKKTTIKDEISKVEAKLAALRITLKNKVKRKSKSFRASYPKAITSGEAIDLQLKFLEECPFEKNSDFQEYIDTCRKINELIDLASLSTTSEQPEANHSTQKVDFMGNDFKNELTIARTINDMVSVSRVWCRLILKYNNLERKNKLPYVEPIQFNSMFELHRVFKNTEVMAIQAEEEKHKPRQPQTKTAA